MTNITFDQFKQLDIRIGTVVEAEVPKWSHWVIKMTVDVGEYIDTDKEKGTEELKNRKTEKLKDKETKILKNLKTKKTITIFAGLLGFYKPEEIIGKQFPFIVNLEPKKIGPEGDYSQGMMLAADIKLKKPVMINDEETTSKPVLLMPSEKVENGTNVR